MSGFLTSLHERFLFLRKDILRNVSLTFLITFSFIAFSGSSVSGQCTAVIGSSIDPLEGCDILTIQFFDQSTGTISRSWDFGDGSDNVVAQNPVHSFTTGDNDTVFTVRLSITCASGTSSTTKQVRVFAKPKVEYRSDKSSVCAITDSICLINTSDYTVSNSFLWNFGDGTISEEYAPCKTYSTPGTYDVSLTVINEKGCLRSVTSSEFVNVEEIPSTAFSVSGNSGCSPFSVVFRNITDTVGNDYSNWTWDFGDGSPQYSGFEPPTHTFIQPGEYTVNLGTTNTLGCFNYSTQKITVKPAPIAQISTSSPSCINDNLVVEYTGAYSGTPTFNWTFTEATAVSGSGEGPYYIRYASAGNKNISLTVTENGCTSSVAQKVQIVPITTVLLQLSANKDTICSGQEVTFTATPVDFATYCFYVNSTQVQCSSVNTYTGNSFSNGDRIYVKITDVNGCTEIVSDTFELGVIQTPAVALISSSPNDTVCLLDNVQFTALPTGYEEYTFYVANEEVQKGSSNVYNTASLIDRERVYATASNNGCFSANSNNIFTTVSDILPKPQVYCGASSSTAIEFRWDEIPGAVGYEISIDNGPFITPSTGPGGLSHLMTGLISNESHSIRVRAYDATVCGEGELSDELTCTAIECDEIAFTLNGQYQDVCENEQVTLQIDGISVPNYMVTWNEQAGTNSNYYSYIATQDTVIPVEVTNLDAPLCPSVIKNFSNFVTPRRDVTLVSSATGGVCSGTPVTFTASPFDFIEYFFYENNLLVQSGPDNRYLVSDPVDGHVFMVTAFEGGCSASSAIQNLEVTDPLEVPQVNYSSSTASSVSFAWDPVAGATGYLISVDNGPFIVPSSGATGLSHTVSLLSPGDAVIVSVIALGDGICGDSERSQPAIGYAESCSGIDYTLETEYHICSGDSVILRVENLNISNYVIKWGNLPPSRKRMIVVNPVSDTTVPVMIRDLDKPLCPAVYNYVHIFVTGRPGMLTLTSSDSDNTICEGDPVIFTAAPGGYDFYEFYDGINLLSGSYLNTYSTDQLSDGSVIRALAYNRGCEGDGSNEITLTVNPALKSPQVNCNGSTTGTVSFAWDAIPGATGYLVSINGSSYLTPSSGGTGLSHDITGLSNGDIMSARVIATGSDPCGNSVPSVVKSCVATNCDAYSAIVAPYDTVCQDEQVELVISQINIPDYSVSWNGGSYGPDTTMLFTATSDSTITVDVKNNTQPTCPVYTRRFEISVIAVPELQLVSNDDDNVLCNGQQVSFVLLPATFDSYRYYNGLNVVQDSYLNKYGPVQLSDGDEIHATADVRGCTALSEKLQMTVKAPAALNLTSTAAGDICTNELVTLTATPGFSHYYFRDRDGIVADAASNSIDYRIYSPEITVTAIDDSYCSTISPDTVRFKLLPLPSMILSCSLDTICFGDFTSYFAQPPFLTGYEFSSSTNGIVQQGSSNIYVTDSLKNSETISVVGIDMNGCRSNSISSPFPYILPYPETTIAAGADGVCLNDSVTLTARKDIDYPSATYYWSTGETTGSIRVSPQYTTTYTLYYNYGMCQNKPLDTKEIGVDRMPAPLAYAGEDTTICIGDSVRLEATGGMQYLWNDTLTLDYPGEYNPLAQPLNTITYVVTVTNLFCKSVDSVTVTVDKCLEALTDPVPQIITPNGDGYNDYWEVYNIDYFQNNRVEIFNRWGNIVYTASPYLNDWDGKNTSGEELPDGTYYYILDIGNGSEPRTGFIIIHR